MCFCEYSWLFSLLYSPLSVCVCLGALWTPASADIPSQPKGTVFRSYPTNWLRFTARLWDEDERRGSASGGDGAAMFGFYVPL